MLIPPPLKKGSNIGIIATARKFTEAQLGYTIELLNSWGYNAYLGESIDAEDFQFAGDDDLRARDLQRFIDEPDINAILIARGGYGTMRMMDKVDFGAMQKFPKWICGFSDVTALHEHLHTLGIASIHSSMPSLFPTQYNHPTLNSLEAALAGQNLSYSFARNAHNKKYKSVQGTLVGGNLSLLYALQGSPSDIDTEGKILFIEDLDEYLYHLDRMLVSLDRAGKLRNLKALLVGGMTAMKDNEDPFGQSVEEIILHHCEKYNYPIVFDFPAGHQEHNYALRMGCMAEIETIDQQVFFKQQL
jgi:muramoyltetrapeptide carboxypeptidase